MTTAAAFCVIATLLIIRLQLASGTTDVSASVSIVNRQGVSDLGIGGTTSLGSGTPCEVVSLPFTFTFYNTTYDMVTICVSGYVQLGNVSDADVYSASVALPSYAAKPSMIAAFWASLMFNMDTFGVFYTTVGSATKRVFVIQWSDIFLAGMTDVKFQAQDAAMYEVQAPLGTFQIQLEELSGRIIFRYLEVHAQPEYLEYKVSIGIQDAVGAHGTNVHFNSSYDTVIRSGLDIIFAASDAITYAVINPAGTISGTFQDVRLTVPSQPGPVDAPMISSDHGMADTTRHYPELSNIAMYGPVYMRGIFTFTWTSPLAGTGKVLTYFIVLADNPQLQYPIVGVLSADLQRTDLVQKYQGPRITVANDTVNFVYPLSRNGTFYWQVYSCNGWHITHTIGCSETSVMGPFSVVLGDSSAEALSNQGGADSQALWQTQEDVGVGLPFNFTFYCSTYDTMDVAEWGVMGFTSTLQQIVDLHQYPDGLKGAAKANEYISTLGFEGNALLGDDHVMDIPSLIRPVAIAPFWANMVSQHNGSDESVLTQTFGFWPNRQFGVQWTQMGVMLADNNQTNRDLTFQAWLLESTGTIVFRYLTLWGNSMSRGRAAVVGVQDLNFPGASKFTKLVRQSDALSNNMTFVLTRSGLCSNMSLSYTSRAFTDIPSYEAAAGFDAIPFRFLSVSGSPVKVRSPSPLANSTVSADVFTLGWSLDDTLASFWQVYISTSPVFDFKDQLMDVIVYSPSLLVNITMFGTYFWRVYACNSLGCSEGDMAAFTRGNFQAQGTPPPSAGRDVALSCSATLINSASWKLPSSMFVNSFDIPVILSFAGQASVRDVCASCKGCVAFAYSMQSANSSGALQHPTLLSPDAITNAAFQAFTFVAPSDGSYSLYLLMSGTLVRNLNVVVSTQGVRISGSLTEFPQVGRNEPSSTSYSSLENGELHSLRLELWFSSSIVNFKPDVVQVSGATLSLVVESDDHSHFKLFYFAHADTCASFAVSRVDVQDKFGNHGDHDLIMSIDLFSGAPISRALAQGPVGVSVSGAAAAILFLDVAVTMASAFSNVISVCSSALQGVFHIQILAMLSEMASPGIGEVFRHVASKLRWSVLSVKGNLGQFDLQFTGTHQALNALQVVGQTGPAGETGLAATLAVQQTMAQMDAHRASNFSVAYVRDMMVITDTQDLHYVLAIAAIIMTIVLLSHILAATLFILLVSPKLHPFLVFPRIEVPVASFMIIALTFYSCLTLGGENIVWRNSRHAAIMVLVLVTMLYTMFLWWLAFARIWACPQDENFQQMNVGRASEDTHTSSSTLSLPGTATHTIVAAPDDESEQEEELVRMAGPHWHLFTGPTFTAATDSDAPVDAIPHSPLLLPAVSTMSSKSHLHEPADSNGSTRCTFPEVHFADCPPANGISKETSVLQDACTTNRHTLPGVAWRAMCHDGSVVGHAVAEGADGHMMSQIGSIIVSKQCNTFPTGCSIFIDTRARAPGETTPLNRQQPLRYARFVAYFEFMFVDLLGADAVHRRDRQTAIILIAGALNFTHKAATAAVLGLWGLQLRSWTQLILLMVLQAVMLVYLVVARPYAEWQLQWLEVAVHTTEMFMFLCAMLLMKRNISGLTWLLTGLLLFSLSTLLLFEIWRLYTLFQTAYHECYCRYFITLKQPRLMAKNINGASGSLARHSTSDSTGVEPPICGRN